MYLMSYVHVQRIFSSKEDLQIPDGIYDSTFFLSNMYSVRISRTSLRLDIKSLCIMTKYLHQYKVVNTLYNGNSLITNAASYSVQCVP